VAYGCIYFLKQECDGCGRCQEPRHSYSSISGSDDTDCPFDDIEEFDEEEW
jgi:hypothetical protein